MFSKQTISAVKMNALHGGDKKLRVVRVWLAEVGHRDSSRLVL